jgi:hypothetical protein
MGHTIPAAVGAAEQNSILETFKAGVKALGIAGKDCFGAAKGDIKLGASGPVVGEIAARLSGGYMSGWTYPYASGAEPVKGAILAALGRKPEGIAPLRAWTCAERAFISIPGKVKAVLDTRKAEEIPYVKNIFLRTGPGEDLRFPENNVGKCGNIIACAPDRDGAVSAAVKAAAAVLIRLEPRHASTGAFLDGISSLPGFPPSAFTLDRSLAETLRLMPDPEPDGKIRNPRILDFPGLRASELRDYAGRTVEESLEAAGRVTGLTLTFVPGNPAPETTAGGPSPPPPPAAPRGDRAPETPEDRGPVLGRRFWAALVRGGYQGAAYLLDGLAT